MNLRSLVLYGAQKSRLVISNRDIHGYAIVFADNCPCRAYVGQKCGIYPNLVQHLTVELHTSLVKKAKGCGV